MDTGQTTSPDNVMRVAHPLWLTQLSWIAFGVVLLTLGNLLKPVLALILGVMTAQAALLPLVNLIQRSLYRLLRVPLAGLPWLQHHLNMRLMSVLIVYLTVFLGLLGLGASVLPVLIQDVERVSVSLGRILESAPARTYTLKPAAFSVAENAFETSAFSPRSSGLRFDPDLRRLIPHMHLQRDSLNLEKKSSEWGALGLSNSWNSMGSLKRLGRAGASVVLNASLQAGTGLATLGFFSLLGVVLVFYALLDPHLLNKLVHSLIGLSEAHRHQMERAGKIFNRFVASYLLLALFSTIVVFIALALANITEASALALTFGVFALIPWLGFWLGLLPVWVLAVGHVSWIYGFGLLGLLALVWALRRWAFMRLLPASLMRYPRKNLPFSALCSVLGSLCLVQAYGLSGLLLSLPLTALIYAALVACRPHSESL